MRRTVDGERRNPFHPSPPPRQRHIRHNFSIYVSFASVIIMYTFAQIAIGLRWSGTRGQASTGVHKRKPKEHQAQGEAIVISVMWKMEFMYRQRAALRFSLVSHPMHVACIAYVREGVRAGG